LVSEENFKFSKKACVEDVWERKRRKRARKGRCKEAQEGVKR
jgi:hypothetical protein